MKGFVLIKEKLPFLIFLPDLIFFSIDAKDDKILLRNI